MQGKTEVFWARQSSLGDIGVFRVISDYSRVYGDEMG